MKSKKKGLRQFFEKSCWRVKKSLGNLTLDITKNLKLILDIRTLGYTEYEYFAF